LHIDNEISISEKSRLPFTSYRLEMLNKRDIKNVLIAYNKYEFLNHNSWLILEEKNLKNVKGSKILRKIQRFCNKI